MFEKPKEGAVSYDSEGKVYEAKREGDQEKPDKDGENQGLTQAQIDAFESAAMGRLMDKIKQLPNAPRLLALLNGQDEEIISRYDKQRRELQEQGVPATLMTPEEKQVYYAAQSRRDGFVDFLRNQYGVDKPTGVKMYRGLIDQLKENGEQKEMAQKEKRQEADSQRLAEVRKQLNTGTQTKPVGGTATKHELAAFFEGGVRGSYARPAIEYSHRVAAAEAGTPIKTGDADKKQLDFLRREAGTFKEGFFGGKEEVARQEKELRDLKMPELLELFRKDKDGKLLRNEVLIEKYKWAAASAPLAAEGVRDFRKAKQFDVRVDASGNILLSTDKRFPHEQFAYNSTTLSLAFFAESEDGDKEFTTLPYLIGGKDKKIVAKGLLVLNAEQRKQLKEAVEARLSNVI